MILKMGYVLELPGGRVINLRFTSHEFMLSMGIGVMRYHDGVNKL